MGPEHNFLSVSDDAHPTSLFCVVHLDYCEHVFMFGVRFHAFAQADGLTS